MMVVKIISGAQTGADQGGLMAAIDLGLDRGGWIPKGRLTESGPLPLDLFELWRLVEHPSFRYQPRTVLNVQDADGTVIFGNSRSAGSFFTLEMCDRLKRPRLIISGHFLSMVRERSEEIGDFRRWLRRHYIRTLNVAGNRESVFPGLQELVRSFIVEALG